MHFVCFGLCIEFYPRFPPLVVFLAYSYTPTCPIVLTIVHFDGTSILSLHNIADALIVLEFLDEFGVPSYPYLYPNTGS
jgi:hypothetical protein